MPLYLYAFIGYELFQIKLYITILRFQFCIINQQNGLCWSKGQPKDLKKLKVIYCFGFFVWPHSVVLWTVSERNAEKKHEIWKLQSLLAAALLNPWFLNLKPFEELHRASAWSKVSLALFTTNTQNTYTKKIEPGKKTLKWMRKKKRQQLWLQPNIYIYVPNITQTTSRLSFSRASSTKHGDTYSLGMR